MPGSLAGRRGDPMGDLFTSSRGHAAVGGAPPPGPESRTSLHFPCRMGRATGKMGRSAHSARALQVDRLRASTQPGGKAG